MTEKGRKYLSDIYQAIELIEEFTISVSDYDTYVGRLKDSKRC